MIRHIIQRSIVIEFENVMQRVKAIIMLHSHKKKILDKDIAEALELSAPYFAVIKKRDKIPYEAIAYFCKKYHISMNWILMAQKPTTLNTPLHPFLEPI